MTVRSHDDDMVVAEGLTRVFTRRERRLGPRVQLRAVDGLDLRVPRGTAVGYIGANGAGKSTTIKMLLGILVPTAGTVRTCGLDPVRQRRRLAARVGVVFGQRSALWWDLPLRDSFDLLAAVHRLDPARARRRLGMLVERLDVGGFMATPVRQLSLGQRMRGEVVAALLHEPDLIVLDEPTVGLDVLSKEQLRVFLEAEVAEQGRTLLLTTHDMGDVERLCSRVLVVDHGVAVFDGSLEALAAEVGARREVVVDLARPVPAFTGASAAGRAWQGAEGAGLRHRFALGPGEEVGPLLTAVGEVAVVRDLSVVAPDAEAVVREVYRRRAAGRAGAPDGDGPPTP